MVPISPIEHLDLDDRAGDVIRGFKALPAGPPIVNDGHPLIDGVLIDSFVVDDINRTDGSLSEEHAARSIEVRRRQKTVHAIVHIQNDDLACTRIAIQRIWNTIGGWIVRGGSKVTKVFHDPIAEGRCPTQRHTSNGRESEEPSTAGTTVDTHTHLNTFRQCPPRGMNRGQTPQKPHSRQQTDPLAAKYRVLQPYHPFDMVSPSTILITGGAGFIGSRYARMIAEDHPDWSIRILDLLTYSGNKANLQGLEGQLTFIRGDIADPDAVHAAMNGCSVVVNFAAESHVDRSLVDDKPFIHTNVEGVQVLLDAAARSGVDRFLQVSTDEVYGDLPIGAKSSLETDRLDPRSPYAASKAAADHLVIAAHRSQGLHTLITRGSNTYGPRQYPEKIIPLFVTNVLEDHMMPVYGDGSAVRDYLHVDDHCRGINLVLREGRPGGIYNLGAGLEVSAQSIAEQICRILGCDTSMIRHVQDRPRHDMRYSIDSTAATSLGWNRSWSFDDGLRRTVQWYIDHHAWWKPIRASDHFKAWEDLWYIEPGRSGRPT